MSTDKFLTYKVEEAGDLESNTAAARELLNLHVEIGSFAPYEIIFGSTRPFLPSVGLIHFAAHHLDLTYEKEAYLERTVESLESLPYSEAYRMGQKKAIQERQEEIYAPLPFSLGSIFINQVIKIEILDKNLISKIVQIDDNKAIQKQLIQIIRLWSQDFKYADVTTSIKSTNDIERFLKSSYLNFRNSPNTEAIHLLGALALPIIRKVIQVKLVEFYRRLESILGLSTHGITFPNVPRVEYFRNYLISTEQDIQTGEYKLDYWISNYLSIREQINHNVKEVFGAQSELAKICLYALHNSNIKNIYKENIIKSFLAKDIIETARIISNTGGIEQSVDSAIKKIINTLEN